MFSDMEVIDAMVILDVKGVIKCYNILTSPPLAICARIPDVKAGTVRFRYILSLYFSDTDTGCLQIPRRSVCCGAAV